MKKSKKDPYANGHTAKTKYGSGDFYGTGVRQKVGKSRMSYVNPPLSKSALKKPPKTLA